MEISRTCETCIVDVHRASQAKHLRSKKQLEKMLQVEMILPECLFKQEQTPIRKKVKNIYNPRTLKPIAREIIKLDDKELQKELAKKMIHPFYLLMKI